MAKKKKYQKTPFEESAKEQMITVSDGSEIRVLSFTDVKTPQEDIAVFFIPGMFSIFPRWEPVVQALNENYPIYYVESREKITSKLVKKAKFDIPRHAMDLADVEKALGLDEKKYITISSSLAGAAVLENHAQKTMTPLGSILISPGVEFHFPRWVLIVLRIIPPFVIQMLKPFIRWLLGDVRVDKKNEPEQSAQYKRSITEADPRKMRKNVLSIAHYNGWDILPKIKDRLILIGATLDTVHESDFVHNVANALTNCSFIDLGTNKAAHDTPLVELTGKFMQELSGKIPKLPSEITPE
ncbi:MAG: hypothetical protein KAS22_07290 [Candidatus Heimdallarchaeota archaeon]|nr:hypothetical protein [Candidatus Heimdallarchaeota archaeon]MCK5185298.1 hypothetical protein [Candidatus Heimdallarchaeota archaeon]